MYKPNLSRVLRIGTETSVLIFERLWRLLGNFYLFILLYRAMVLSCAVFLGQMARTRATVSGGRGETAPEVAPVRGRGRA